MNQYFADTNSGSTSMPGQAMGPVIPLPPSLDPMAMAVDPTNYLSAQDQAAFGMTRLRGDMATAFAYMQQAAVAGTFRAAGDVFSVSRTAGGMFPSSMAQPYQPMTATFGQSMRALMRLNEPTNMTPSQYRYYATQDISQRMAIAGTSVVTDVIAPTLAFSPGWAGGAWAGGAIGFAAGGPVGATIGGFVGGLAGGMASSSVVQRILGADKIREHLRLSAMVEEYSPRFITSAVSGHPLGRGFARAEQNEIVDSMRQGQTKDFFFNQQDYEQIFRQGTTGGLFDTVRSVDNFKRRFNEVKDSLKTIMQTLHQSTEQGIQTLSSLASMGVMSQPQVRAFIGQATAAGAISGVSTGLAVQNAVTSAEMFRGTGVQMQFGANLANRNLESAGAMVSGNTISLELTRQLGGTLGVANTMTQMQTNALFNNTQNRRAMMAAMMPGGGLNAEALGRYMSGRQDPFDTSHQALQNMLSRGTNYYAFLGAQAGLIGQMTPEQAQAMTIAPLMNIANRLHQVMPGLDVNDDNTLKGIAMRFGIARNDNEAELLVTQRRNLMNPNIGAIRSTRTREAVLRSEMERANEDPTIFRQAAIGTREFFYGIERGVVGASTSLERGTTRFLDRIQGIDTFDYKGIGRTELLSAMNVGVARVGGTINVNGERDLARIDKEISAIKPADLSRAEALEARANRIQSQGGEGGWLQMAISSDEAGKMRREASGIRSSLLSRGGDMYTKEQYDTINRLSRQRSEISNKMSATRVPSAEEILNVTESRLSIGHYDNRELLQKAEREGLLKAGTVDSVEVLNKGISSAFADIYAQNSGVGITETLKTSIFGAQATPSTMALYEYAKAFKSGDIHIAARARKTAYNEASRLFGTDVSERLLTGTEASVTAGRFDSSFALEGKIAGAMTAASATISALAKAGAARPTLGPDEGAEARMRRMMTGFSENGELRNLLVAATKAGGPGEDLDRLIGTAQDVFQRGGMNIPEVRMIMNEAAKTPALYAAYLQGRPASREQVDKSVYKGMADRKKEKEAQDKQALEANVLMTDKTRDDISGMFREGMNEGALSKSIEEAIRQSGKQISIADAINDSKLMEKARSIYETASGVPYVASTGWDSESALKITDIKKLTEEEGKASGDFKKALEKSGAITSDILGRPYAKSYKKEGTIISIGGIYTKAESSESLSVPISSENTGLIEQLYAQAGNQQTGAFHATLKKLQDSGLPTDDIVKQLTINGALKTTKQLGEDGGIKTAVEAAQSKSAIQFQKRLQVAAQDPYNLDAVQQIYALTNKDITTGFNKEIVAANAGSGEDVKNLITIASGIKNTKTGEMFSDDERKGAKADLAERMINRLGATTDGSSRSMAGGMSPALVNDMRAINASLIALEASTRELLQEVRHR